MTPMDVKQLSSREFATMAKCLDAIEAQEQLSAIYAASFAEMKKQSRDEYFKSLKRRALQISSQDKKPVVGMSALKDLLHGR